MFDLCFFKKNILLNFFILLIVYSNSYSGLCCPNQCCPSSCCSNPCVDLSSGNGIISLLHAQHPASKIIRGDNFCIKKGGSYHIIENMCGNIIVAASNVIINLNGFTLAGDNNPIINVACCCRNVVIKNGAISGNGCNNGICVQQGAKGVKIENIHILNCNNGLKFCGGSCYIKCCKVENCLFTCCDKGVVFNCVMKCMLKNCKACCCNISGFELACSKFNIIQECIALGVGSVNPTQISVGFLSNNGEGNLFDSCIAEGTYNGNSEGQAFGFLLEGEEIESKIINCLANSTKTVFDADGIAYGIQCKNSTSSCVIDSNKVCNTFGTSIDFGVPEGIVEGAGLSASSDGNLVTRNVCYNNRNISGLANFEFVDPLFIAVGQDSAPRELDNISLP